MLVLGRDWLADAEQLNFAVSDRCIKDECVLHEFVALRPQIATLVSLRSNLNKINFKPPFSVLKSKLP